MIFASKPLIRKRKSRTEAAIFSFLITVISPDIEKQLNQVDDTGKTVSEPLQSNDVRQTWITDRKAFYQRNYELSEQSYQKVIDSATWKA